MVVLIDRTRREAHAMRSEVRATRITAAITFMRGGTAGTGTACTG